MSGLDTMIKINSGVRDRLMQHRYSKGLESMSGAIADLLDFYKEHKECEKPKVKGGKVDGGSPARVKAEA